MGHICDTMRNPLTTYPTLTMPKITGFRLLLSENCGSSTFDYHTGSHGGGVSTGHLFKSYNKRLSE
jgi:hypothetical protein